MKIINYTFLAGEINNGTKEKPDIQKIFRSKSMVWNEANEEAAKREAYNGEYTIEDDGKGEPEPTQLDTIEAQVAYIAMMTGLLEV